MTGARDGARAARGARVKQRRLTNGARGLAAREILRCWRADSRGGRARGRARGARPACCRNCKGRRLRAGRLSGRIGGRERPRGRARAVATPSRPRAGNWRLDPAPPRRARPARPARQKRRGARRWQSGPIAGPAGARRRGGGRFGISSGGESARSAESPSPGYRPNAAHGPNPCTRRPSWAPVLGLGVSQPRACAAEGRGGRGWGGRFDGAPCHSRGMCLAWCSYAVPAAAQPLSGFNRAT